ncbi:MAG: 3'-5' exonuclease [Spirochaetales bacterium]|nr:3'-5' exonuclease [Spirochaetales bacterium]
MDFEYIKTGEELSALISDLNNKERIAVDFEGEFNLHIYGEHLCLIQVFDGERYYIIDPRGHEMKRDALIAFFTSPVKKVWFDMQSDNALIHKNYNTVLNNVVDTRVLAMCLGYTGNLTGLIEKYLGITTEVTDKKKLQQTNWLKRPLSPEQLNYALSDVEYLFQLEDILTVEVEKAGLTKQAETQMKKAHKVSPEKPGWKKIGNWKLLNEEQRKATREYFIARDVVAKRFNVPAYFVLDKHKIITVGKICPRNEKDLFKYVGDINPRFERYLTDSLKKAFSNLHP